MNRRRLLGWGGLATAVLMLPEPEKTGTAPPGTRPGGAYDRYVAQLAADPAIAHPYMTVAGGGQADAVRHLDQSSSLDYLAGRNPGRAYVDALGDGGFATAPDLVRFARALRDGTLLAKPWADVLLAPKAALGPSSFGTYGPSAEIAGGQWALQRAGGNPGVCANWSLYPDTDWVGIILGNTDDVPLPEMIAQEVKAITGADPGDGGGG